MTVKSRSYPTLLFRGHYNETRRGLTEIVYKADPRNRDFYGFETLVSYGHPWPPRKGYSSVNIGGDYSVRRSEQQVTPGYANGRSWIGSPGPSALNYYFDGFVIPNNAVNGVRTSSSLPAPVAGSTMLAQGTKGWARYKPTRSRGGLDQAIGEIHQIPTIYQVKRLREAMLNMRHNQGWERALSKAAGENYLNYVFGWVPLISDLIDLVDNSYKLEARMRQLLRDNDKPVRRSGAVDSSATTSATNTSGSPAGLSYPALASPLYEINERESVTTAYTQDFRFSGRFRYHIVDPRPYSDGKLTIKPREAYQLQRILFGGEFTPETLYNITPWTWLLDWVVPMGDIVNNFVNDAVDNLVADYAYISCHTLTTTTRVVQGKLRNGPPYQTSSVLRQEVKQRTGASPYGFGLTFGDLSPKRLAILAALGFTKLQ